ncbi:LOW QUALITY PROTEIN: polyhomeotic-like protein 1 [Perognathus longimembris pacificus]|uniref:LOW QUALITY PROTEIN: polyhomeotic-like protein 1 n=1 Tax=Perognathus longimembris pacificus TaxID=214514 RepID=UPI00201A1A2A|nr:LOW QUALITY PROTEIN: polyhomeotic-like protein 1 [Perognathus longimembris pacificus]
METESEQNPNSAGAGSGGSARPQIAQMSLYERQAVQALQALQRQPNAAQYFHQFMLQQQLSNAQLHSLAAVQQATIAASRQASSPNPSAVPPPQPASTTQASMNAAPTPAAAAQLASRSQSASSPGATTLTQSVLLGNAASPPLSQSQAQMYLRVNRTLGRNVPLASQLILMPNGAVAAVQPEGPPAPPGAPSPGGHPDAARRRRPGPCRTWRCAGPRPPRRPRPRPRARRCRARAPSRGSRRRPGLGPRAGRPGAALPVGEPEPGGRGRGRGRGRGGLPGPLGLGAGGPAPGGGGGGGGLGPLPASPALAGGGCPRKGTGVVQPLPVAAQAAALGPGGGGGGGAEAEAAKKAEGDAAGAGGGAAPSAGVNLTRTAAPAPSQTLISSATYTQIQPHSLIQRQQQIHLQQKQVVIQQQIAIHHQPQFPHRQSQLLHAAAAAAHLQLQPPPAAPPAAPAPPPPAAHPPAPPGPPPPPPPAPTQTLVVQPMLQAAPLPIQAKPAAAAAAPAPPPKPPAPGAAPHIPVQVVGARQPGPAHAQALGLAQLAAAVPAARGPAPPAGPALAAASPPSAQAPGRSRRLAVKRKAESEEERGALPARGAEDKGGLGEKAEAASGGAPSLAGGELEAAVLAPAPPAPAPSLALVSRPAGDSRPPQAIVKPQILTHIIEGFVIQEGAEPFPVACAQLLKESEKALPSGLPPGLGQSPSGGALGGDSPSVELEKPASLLKCEYCGKYAPAEQFRGSKRFCSMTCAKRYNVSCSHQFRLKRKKMKEFQEASYARVRRRGPRRSSADMARAKAQGKRHRGQEDSSRGSDNSSYDEALSPTSPGPLGRAGHAERELGGALAAPPTPELHGASPEFLPAHPSRWSVEEVYEFIASLQGCQDIAEEFRSQEIDGQALLLLKEEHLMSAMNLKLGPALKICAKINVLKEA